MISRRNTIVLSALVIGLWICWYASSYAFALIPGYEERGSGISDSTAIVSFVRAFVVVAAIFLLQRLFQAGGALTDERRAITIGLIFGLFRLAFEFGGARSGPEAIAATVEGARWLAASGLISLAIYRLVVEANGKSGTRPAPL